MVSFVYNLVFKVEWNLHVIFIRFCVCKTWRFHNLIIISGLLIPRKKQQGKT
jgi:hypothetical protein